MDPLELSALTGAGSAFVAALSYWAKTNHERRRVTRTVLYYLLELHHVVHRVHTALVALESELITALRGLCQARGLHFDEENTAAELKKAMPAFSEFGRNELKVSVTASADAFTKALSDLARENPVLAFRLRGRDQLILLRDKIEVFAKAHGGATAQPGDVPDVQWSEIDGLLFSLSVEDLRKAIRSTLWGCDVITHVRTELLLRSSSRERASGDLTRLVKRTAEKYMASLPT